MQKIIQMGSQSGGQAPEPENDAGMRSPSPETDEEEKQPEDEQEEEKDEGDSAVFGNPKRTLKIIKLDFPTNWST